jgi:hypothetical protein
MSYFGGVPQNALSEMKVELLEKLEQLDSRR